MSSSRNSKTLLLEPTQAGIEKASKLLENDELVAFPTETVFGLGASAISNGAVKKIFKVKERPSYNPLIVHISDPQHIFLWANVPVLAQKLIDCFWPGPLTLVLQRKTQTKLSLSSLVTAELPTVAIRVPMHPVALSLIKNFGRPIAAPSANISGKISATRTKDVLTNFNGKISAILNEKPCKIGVESTIIGFEQDEPRLLRSGGITVEDLKRRLGISFSTSNFFVKSNEKILAPGMLKSHYAPNAQLRLNVTRPKKDELFLGFGKMPSVSNGISLSEKSNLTEAASNLFAALNDLDSMAKNMQIKTIAVAPIPNSGLGYAINERLVRAAFKKS